MFVITLKLLSFKQAAKYVLPQKEEKMKANEVALVLTGYQNEFCSPDGKLHSLIKDMLASNKIIQNTVDLLSRAQKKGIPAYIASIVFTPGYPELQNPVGILKNIKEIGAFMKGTKGAEVIDELKPFMNYLQVVEGKTGLSCFGHTNLDGLLTQVQQPLTVSP